MNIYLRFLCFILISIFFSGCVKSVEEKSQTHSIGSKACEKANSGKLQINKLNNLNSHEYAYLLNCVLAPFVAFPDESQLSIRQREEAKQKLADFLLTKNIDTDFRDETESSLLISVIGSYFPKSWKIETTKKLISKGVNVHAKNKYDKSALDLAIFSGDKEIAEILKQNIK